MKSAAQYIAEAKEKLGNPRMSDRELGLRLGDFGGTTFVQSYVAGGKSGKMTDPLAIAIARAIGIPPGEVVWVARIEREKTPEVASYLQEWMLDVKKAMAQASKKAANLLVAGAVALGLLFLPAREVEAAGGAGRFRR